MEFEREICRRKTIATCEHRKLNFWSAGQCSCCVLVSILFSFCCSSQVIYKLFPKYWYIFNWSFQLAWKLFFRNAKIFGGFKWPTHIWALEQSFRNVKPVHASATVAGFQGFHISKTSKNFFCYIRPTRVGFASAALIFDISKTSKNLYSTSDIQGWVLQLLLWACKLHQVHFIQLHHYHLRMHK